MVVFLSRCIGHGLLSSKSLLIMGAIKMWGQEFSVVQWVKDPALSLQWLESLCSGAGLIPGLGISICCRRGGGGGGGGGGKR